ncbi:MAG: hypothetical protein L6R38_009028 [Xanthoria sp. 2 TBL-2021]|nr:MAG: hypothetical protein L6R38_009028 [Xanthoria sp. 2 TBL-2021]
MAVDLKSSDPFFLFGGPKSDDRVRGGSSRSSLSVLPSNCALFEGYLDIETLGGAGFASQFQYPASENEGSKSSNDGVWDLSAYEGIELDVGASDGKVYTLILKDEEAQDKRDDGREKAGLNWEADFRANKGSQGPAGEEVVRKNVWIPWSDLKPTYRGKKKDDAGLFKPGEIRRIGFMMRSFFGTQQGDFRLELRSITARKHASNGADATVDIQE